MLIYLVEWHCCVNGAVPEAIHNLVTIKLLVSDVYVMHTCFYIMTGFVYRIYI